MEITTKKAGALILRPVNQQALLDIILDMGGMEAAATPENLLSNPNAMPAANRMITYCAGWGVENDPPQSALDTLAALGKPVDLPEIARANWLRYMVLDNEECSELIRVVMAETFRS
ncbi:MAG: hypothetical protein KKC37_16935 [Proteobacteria bacterium]|nr:hypothetical protein [Pseudomonadota bacterium]